MVSQDLQRLFQTISILTPKPLPYHPHQITSPALQGKLKPSQWRLVDFLLCCLKYLSYHATLLLFLFGKKYPSSLPSLTLPSVLFPYSLSYVPFLFSLIIKLPFSRARYPLKSSILPSLLYFLKGQYRFS